MNKDDNKQDVGNNKVYIAGNNWNNADVDGVYGCVEGVLHIDGLYIV